MCGLGGPRPSRRADAWEARVGNLEAGFAEADLIVTGRYATRGQVTLPIETHVCTAMWKGDDLHLWDSQQSVFAARSTLAETLGIPEERVHIYAEYVGGGFGGKCLDYPDEDLYQLYAAILAKQTGRPVRFEFTLNEEMAAGDSRHPLVFETRWGVKKDGTITAQYWKVLADTGPYDFVLGRRRPHRLPASGRHLSDAQLHRGGLRGLHQQSGWLVSSAASAGCRRRSRRNCTSDKVAQELGINPLDFRLKNTKRPGDLINNDHSLRPHRRRRDRAPCGRANRLGALAAAVGEDRPHASRSRDDAGSDAQRAGCRATGSVWIDRDGTGASSVWVRAIWATSRTPAWRSSCRKSWACRSTRCA